MIDPASTTGVLDREVEKGNQWTRPVTPEVIAAARRGNGTSC